MREQFVTVGIIIGTDRTDNLGIVLSILSHSTDRTCSKRRKISFQNDGRLSAVPCLIKQSCLKPSCAKRPSKRSRGTRLNAKKPPVPIYTELSQYPKTIHCIPASKREHRWHPLRSFLLHNATLKLNSGVVLLQSRSRKAKNRPK